MPGCVVCFPGEKYSAGIENPGYHPQAQIWQTLAILVVLAEPEPEITARVRDIGVDGMIRTPLSPEEVDQELHKALNAGKYFLPMDNIRVIASK